MCKFNIYFENQNNNCTNYIYTLLEEGGTVAEWISFVVAGSIPVAMETHGHNLLSFLSMFWLCFGGIPVSSTWQKLHVKGRIQNQ